MYIDKDLKSFTDALASKEPVPGGGGASALVASVGMALGSMVGALTVGKKRYAAIEPDMIVWMERAERLRTELLGHIDADAEAFMPLSEVYRMPKDAPGRAELLEDALAGAAEVPLRLIHLCCEAIDLLEKFGEHGSRLAISDAATGAAVCRAALDGAWINLRVNTSAMKDRTKAV